MMTSGYSLLVYCFRIFCGARMLLGEEMKPRGGVQGTPPPSSGNDRTRTCERFPFAGLDDSGNGCDRELDFVVASVEVWRDPDSRTGPVVHENLASEQRLRYLIAVGNVNGDGSAPLVRVFGGVDGPALFPRQVDQSAGLPGALRPYPVQPCPPYEPRALDSRIKGRNRRCAAEPALSAVRILHFLLEGERARMRLPAGYRGLQRSRKPRTHVKEAPARTTAQPLQHAAAQEVHPEVVHVHRKHAHGMVRIQGRQRPRLPGAVTDRCRVHHERRLEKHVRHGHQRRMLIDCLEQSPLVNGDAIIAGNHHESRTETSREALVHVAHRRKVQLSGYEHVPRRLELHGRHHRSLCGGYVRHHCNLAVARTEQRCHLIPNTNGQVPPFTCPGTNPELVPGIGVFRHSRCGGTRHCTERVGHQVRAALQNRELAAKLQELVRRRTPHGSHGCTGDALWNSASAFHVGTMGASATIRTKPSTTLDSCTAPRRSKSGRYSSPGW